jgi:hypothetical protein
MKLDRQRARRAMVTQAGSVINTGQRYPLRSNSAHAAANTSAAVCSWEPQSGREQAVRTRAQRLGAGRGVQPGRAAARQRRRRRHDPPVGRQPPAVGPPTPAGQPHPLDGWASLRSECRNSGLSRHSAICVTVGRRWRGRAHRVPDRQAKRGSTTAISGTGSDHLAVGVVAGAVVAA